MSAPFERFPHLPSAKAAFGQPFFLIGESSRDGAAVTIAGDGLNEHWHVCGKSKSGKSNLLTSVSLQIAFMEEGGLLLDQQGTQGGFTDRVLELGAKYRLYRRKKIIVLDFSSDIYAPSLDMLRVPKGATVRAVVDGAISAIGRAWGEADIRKTPRLRRVLTHLFTALIELRLTILEAGIFLWDEQGAEVRDALIAQIPSLATRRFWERVVRLPAGRRDEYLESASSRMEPFLGSPYIRRIFGQPERALDLAREMDAGSLIIVRLPWDNLRLSAEDTRLIGALILNQLMAACYQRRRPERRFWTIVDECAEFLTEDVALALDKMRKRGLRLVLAHQHLGHLREAGEKIESAVMNNCGVRVVFGGLVEEDNRVFALLMWRGFFDLQKVKRKLTRIQAIGNIKKWLRGMGLNWSNSHADARNWSDGTHEGTQESETVGSRVAHSQVETLQGGDGASHTVEKPADGADKPAREMDGTNEHSGWALALGRSADRSNAKTHGTSTGRDKSVGGSTADTVGKGGSLQWAEAYVTRYGEVPAGDTWTLEEQIHLRAVSLANVKVGECHIKVQTARPQRVHPRYLGDTPILPSMTERVTEKLMAESEYNGLVEAVDMAISARLERLAALTPPRGRRSGRTLTPLKPEIDADDPNDDAAWQRLQARTEGSKQ